MIVLSANRIAPSNIARVETLGSPAILTDGVSHPIHEKGKFHKPTMMLELSSLPNYFRCPGHTIPSIRIYVQILHDVNPRAYC